MTSRQFVTSCEVLGSRDSDHAGRPAIDVDLRGEDGDITLGVDAGTGVWTYLKPGDLTITIDHLELGEHVVAAEMFRLLDQVPDIVLSHREPVVEALEGFLEVVRHASGLDAEVLYQDEQTGEFRFLLLDAANRPAGLISRLRVLDAQSPRVFGGVQDLVSGEGWEYHVDTTGTDPRWADQTGKAIRECEDTGSSRFGASSMKIRAEKRRCRRR